MYRYIQHKLSVFDFYNNVYVTVFSATALALTDSSSDLDPPA